MMRAIVISAAIFAAAPHAVAVTPTSSPAVIVSIRTGEVIGAAEACGVPHTELVELGRKVIGWPGKPARHAGELQRAQAAHESAVGHAAARVRRAGQGACAAAVRSFRQLERDRR